MLAIAISGLDTVLVCLSWKRWLFTDKLLENRQESYCDQHRCVLEELSFHIEKDDHVVSEGIVFERLHCTKTHTATAANSQPIDLVADSNLWHQHMA